MSEVKSKYWDIAGYDPVHYGPGGPGLMTNGPVSAKLITATISAGDLNIIPQTNKDLFCKSYFTEIVTTQALNRNVNM